MPSSKDNINMSEGAEFQLDTKIVTANEVKETIAYQAVAEKKVIKPYYPVESNPDYKIIFPKGPTKVEQKHFTTETTIGNCLQAALATLLDLPLERVIDLRPKIYDKSLDKLWEQHRALDVWLTRNKMMHFEVDGDIMLDTYYLGSGYCSRSDKFLHTVVMRNGMIYHDPHPTREGINEVKYSTIIFPVNTHNHVLRKNRISAKDHYLNMVMKLKKYLDKIKEAP